MLSQLEVQSDCPAIAVMVSDEFWSEVTVGNMARGPGACAIHHFELFQFIPRNAA